MATGQEDAPTIEPASEFSGIAGTCPDTTFMGGEDFVVLGPLDDGNLVRREWRGWRFTGNVEGLSDPRLDGALTVHVNIDEYIHPGVDLYDAPMLVSSVMRIENERGAWQGSYAEAGFPGSPLPYGELVPLAGEGEYEGLTAIWWTELQDPDCTYSCEEPESQCVVDIYGLVFPGEMPPTPDV